MSDRYEELVAKLAAKPWNAASIPDAVYRPVGMIGPEERRALWWLARELLGDGAIVDAGCFVGASTFCLAAGAAASPRAALRRGPIVHAFDHFAAIDEYVVQAIAQHFRPTKAGDSYLDIFEQQLSPHQGIVTAVAGDFAKATWSGEPIDLLFIDIAKTDALGAHVVGTFFSSLVPGRSAVVQQDFHHCWHPMIHVTMEYLAEEFVVLDELIEHQSRLWLLKRPIPQEKIRRLAERRLDRVEQLALLDRLVDRSTGQSRPMMELVRAWHLVRDNRLDAAEAAIASLRSRLSLEMTESLCWAQTVQVEDYVRRLRAESLKHGVRS